MARIIFVVVAVMLGACAVSTDYDPYVAAVDNQLERRSYQTREIAEADYQHLVTAVIEARYLRFRPDAQHVIRAHDLSGRFVAQSSRFAIHARDHPIPNPTKITERGEHRLGPLEPTSVDGFAIANLLDDVTPFVDFVALSDALELASDGVHFDRAHVVSTQRNRPGLHQGLVRSRVWPRVREQSDGEYGRSAGQRNPNGALSSQHDFAGRP